MMRKLCLLLIFALHAGALSSPSLRADSSPAKTGQGVQLQLANGDRVSGEVIWRADGKIRIRSPFIGDFTLNEADVAVLDLPEERADRPAAQPVPSTPPPANAARSPAVSPKTSEPKSASASAAKPAANSWKGKVEMGIAQQSGRVDAQSHHLRAEAEQNRGRHNLRATGRVLYAEQNSKPSADRSDAAFRWRYQITKRSFSQSQSTYYRDDVTRIALNLEQNVGLGYRFIDQPRHILNFGGGLTAQYREWNAGRNGFAPYLEIFQDYTFKINDRISLVQDLSVQYSPEDRAYSYTNNQVPQLSPDQQNYKIRLNGTLQGKITERISANLRFEYEQDNAIKLANARTLQRITSSLGYAF
jgi:putative salt-induced outer membrane protein YdiY